MQYSASFAFLPGSAGLMLACIPFGKGCQYFATASPLARDVSIFATASPLARDVSILPPASPFGKGCGARLAGSVIQGYALYIYIYMPSDPYRRMFLPLGAQEAPHRRTVGRRWSKARLGG